MKILILAQEISLDQPGGSGRVAWEQARILARRGHTVALVTPLSRKGLKKEERKDGVTIFRFGDIKRRTMLGRSIADIMDTPKIVRQLLSTSEWDFLIAHHPHIAYGAMRIYAARKIPMFYV